MAHKVILGEDGHDPLADALTRITILEEVVAQQRLWIQQLSASKEQDWHGINARLNMLEKRG